MSKMTMFGKTKIHQNQLKAHFKHLGLSTREYLTLNRKYSQGLTNHMHD